MILRGQSGAESPGAGGDEDAANECLVSHATAWEMAIKLNLGKLELGLDYGQIFPGVLDANKFSLLPPALAHYQALISLPAHHGDPFDRLIIGSGPGRVFDHREL